MAVTVAPHRVGLAGDGGLFSVAKDGGYGEFFQYLKFGAISLLLWMSARVQKSALMGGWAAIFLMLLIDDSIKLHERLGGQFVAWFSIPSAYGLRAQDYGEIMVFLMLGAIALAILVLTSRMDRAPAARSLSKYLLLFLVGLAFFGGLVDMAHIYVDQTYGLSPKGNRMFAAVEDGGEMIVISLALWFVYRFYLSLKSSRPQKFF